jgi:hypothetical protein
VAERISLVALGPSCLRLALEHDPEKRALGLRPDRCMAVSLATNAERVCAEIMREDIWWPTTRRPDSFSEAACTL